MEINKAGSFKQLTQGTGQIKPKETSQASGDQVQLGADRPDVPVGEHKKWLFMNFIAADCNLKEFQANNIDNQELVGSDKNTHIVAMIDVGPGAKMEEPAEGEKAGSAKPSTIDWKGCRTYYVSHDTVPGKINSPVIEEQGMDVNMSKPETLTKFIVDTMKKFPSDNVALILNDHGGGFTGALADDTQGGFMSTPNIHKAISDAEKITGKKIDIVGFDACLMAQAEVANELKSDAKILLASEETEGGPGWTYNGMLQSDKSMPAAISMLQAAMTKKIDVSPEEFAKIVVKINDQHNKDIATFSATDLSKIEGVTKATDELAKAILDTDQKTAVKDAIMKAENYGGWQKPMPYADMRDLTHIADLLEKNVADPKLKEAAQNVKKAIGEAVIANESDPEKYPNSKGLSIYAPTDKPGGLEYKYGDLAFAKETKWDEAMTSLGNVPSSNPGGGKEGGLKPEDLAGLSEQDLFALLGMMSGAANADGTPKVWPDGSERKS